MTRYFLLPFLIGLAACAAPPPGPEPLNMRTATPRAIGVQPSPETGRWIGTSHVQFGDAAYVRGAWVLTSLVRKPQSGWVRDLETGRAAKVQLLPYPGFDGLDLISLEAMRDLGVEQPRVIILSVFLEKNQE